MPNKKKPEVTVEPMTISTSAMAKILGIHSHHLLNLRRVGKFKRSLHWVDISTGEGDRPTYRWFTEPTKEKFKTI